MASDGDAEIDHLAAALRALGEVQGRSQRELAATRAQLAQLVELLVAREILNDGHRRHLARVARHADPTPEPKVRLRQYVDKYGLAPGEPIDCAARIPLCKARCCSFRVALTAQDIQERKLDWDLMEPYVLPRGEDRYCGYLDRAGGGCTVYGHRPATCREYSCREDRRVWIDFDRRIPAPPPVRDDELLSGPASLAPGARSDPGS
jgi:hypothetical protein